MSDMAHLHPMLVHFPIALLIVGVVFDLLRAIGSVKLANLSTFGLWSTTVGLVMMLPAIASGLLAHTFQAAPDAHVQTLINYHERLSYLELVLFGVLVAWRWDGRGDDQSIMPRGYLMGASLGVLLLISSGYLGGLLVYSYRMGVEPCPAGSSPTAPADSAPTGAAG